MCKKYALFEILQWCLALMQVFTCRFTTIFSVTGGHGNDFSTSNFFDKLYSLENTRQFFLENIFSLNSIFMTVLILPTSHEFQLLILYLIFYYSLFLLFQATQLRRLYHLIQP